MTDEAALYLFGAIGAAFYGFPLYLASRKNKDEAFGLPILLFTIAVGSVFGGVVTPFIGAKAAWTVDPSPVPLALGVGLLSNKWLPKIIEKGVTWFDGWNGGGIKK